MSGTIKLEQIDIFDFFKDFVNDSVHDNLKKMCNIPDEEEFVYDDILYYPTYSRDEQKNKFLKTLNVMHSKFNSTFLEISIDEIEKSGATWEEFLFHLKNKEAHLVNYKDVL